MGILAVIVVVVVIAIAVPVVTGYYHHRTVTTTINDKERVCSGNGGSCKYLVYTNAGTFEITDALFGAHRFDSSDVYGRVIRHRRYKLVVYGWRFGPSSMYPNIISLKLEPK